MHIPAHVLLDEATASPAVPLSAYSGPMSEANASNILVIVDNNSEVLELRTVVIHIL